MLTYVQFAPAVVWAGALAALLAVAGCGWGRSDPVPVYCYRTLADIACYDAPDLGRERQLVGVYLLEPSDPAWPVYAARRDASVLSR